MADSKITQLPNFVGNPSGSEPMETVQSGASVQITSQKIADLATIVTPVNLAGMTALISSNGISSYRLYVITNATDGRILVKGLTTNTLEVGALNLTTGESGTYNITTDTFTATTSTPDLQQVTDVGFTTTNRLVSDDGAGNAATLNNGIIVIQTGNTGSVDINASQATADYTAQLPDKPLGIETFAMLSDLTGLGGITKATAAGTDTYTTTITGVTGYVDGDTYLIRFTNGNTTAATLDINTLGAKSLYRNNDGALIGGDIWDGGEMLCIFNSTLNGFQCIGTSPNSLFAYVTNAETSTAITKGQAVYVFGGQGDRITVKLASNQSDTTSAQTIGIVVTSSIAVNQRGIIIVQGQLDGLSLFPTSTWADGDFVYLGATAGTVTKTKPYAPDHLVYLGYVVKASAGSAGRMYVKVQNGYEMQELHNVSAQNPNDGDLLKYNTTTSLWETQPDLSIAYAYIFG
jgi:hypothetical protein